MPGGDRVQLGTALGAQITRHDDVRKRKKGEMSQGQSPTGYIVSGAKSQYRKRKGRGRREGGGRNMVQRGTACRVLHHKAGRGKKRKEEERRLGPGSARCSVLDAKSSGTKMKGRDRRQRREERVAKSADRLR